MVTTNAIQEHAKATPLPIIHILTPPTSLLPYNISLNLSSLFAIFPTSGILSRIKQGMPWSGRSDIEYPTTTTAMEWSMETLETLAEVAQPEPTSVGRPPPVESFPGPWAFFTSRYMLALFVLAIVVHRIQNVIIPPQRNYPRRRQRHAFRFAFNFATTFDFAQRIKGWILPMDFSRTSTRFVAHLPSAYLMCRMLLVWGLLLVQTAPELQNLPKMGGFEWLDRLVQWVAAMEMRDVCWGTFCAASAAMVVEGAIKALDGRSMGWIGNTQFNASPFNLVAYAYLLSVYSSPVTHTLKSSDSEGPSRPDKHVVITMGIPFLQLTIFHLLSISKRLSRHRLLPTTFTTALSLLHFHGALYSYYRRTRLHSMTPSQSRPRVHLPLLNYVPNLIETVLIFSILLTITLNAVAQLLVRGHIDRVFSGLGIQFSLQDDESGLQGLLTSLPFEEDFGVILLRVGLASLEATGLKGWCNEAAPIAAMDTKIRPTGSIVRIGRMGVHEVLHETHTTSLATSKHMVRPSQRTGKHADRRSKKKLRHGFYNEVCNIDLGVSRTLSPWVLYVKGLLDYMLAVCYVLFGLALRLTGRERIPEATDVNSSTPSGDEVVSTQHQQSWQSKEDALYQRFLRGEDISDDEDEVSLDESDSDSDFGEDLNEEDDDSRQAEAISLFTDLVRNGGMPPRSQGEIAGGGEMVLAHLVHGGGSAVAPLTRRRWNELFQMGDVHQRRRWLGDESSNDYEDGDAHSLPPAKAASDDSESPNTFENVCVICATEKRNVICWPCRCLAICDGCREVLASKSIPAKHQCPCCRQSVDGYSKIYIP